MTGINKVRIGQTGKSAPLVIKRCPVSCGLPVGTFLDGFGKWLGRDRGKSLNLGRLYSGDQ